METRAQRPSSLRSELSPNPAPQRRVQRRDPASTQQAEPEVALRLGPDGTVETVPLTREILLNPSLDVQVPQSRPHYDELHVLGERLRSFLRALGLRVYSDVIINWPNVRDVSPDLSVFENLRERGPEERTPESVDVAAEGCRVRAVFEFVSSGAKSRWKDETKNPPLFAQQGVEDCVLLYLPDYRKATDPPIRLLSNPTAPSGYVEQRPDPQGFFLLRSIGVRIGVERTSDGVESIVLLDARTGQRLPDMKEETEARRKAEQEKKLEAKARRKAEKEKRKAEQEKKLEAEARKKAEQEKKLEAEAREKAEKENKLEAEARKEAEKELERLRAQLRKRDDGG